MKKIVALIDGSEFSRSVCDHAAWIAARTGAAVEALHVLGRRQGVKPKQDLSGNIALGARTALLEELAAHDEAAGRLAQKRGRAILEDAHDILAAGGARDIATRLRVGDIVEAAAQAEADADLVLIGMRGEASADRAPAHLGSNFERIARALTCPILTVPTAFKPIARVLIAHDGGPSSLKAVDWISRSPLFPGIALKVLTVAEPGPEAEKRLETARGLLSAAGLEVATELASGAPDAAILQAVRRDGADLLAMGAYGHSRLRALFIGSTTTEMVRSSPVPVLMFR